MRKALRSVALMGVAACFATGAAMAASNDGRMMTVDLPDEPLIQITYTGDIAQGARIIPDAHLTPVWLHPFHSAPFTMLERMSLEMDRTFAAMMRQAETMKTVALAQSNGMTFASRTMPSGTVRYSYVMTGEGGSYCSKSVQIMSNGSGAKPSVVSQSSGDCGAGSAPAENSQRSDARGRLPANMI
ncbi:MULTISPECIES: hypothetical protein [Sphingobium]|uniref:Uncharacterized protein n=1 Tax=Sphingobium chungbukense TaxID=56193 RepID=A0A0M3AKN9_9SPHN|nr:MULTISPECIES: hypothetical protein [Sphingobium]AMK26120.1 hypothetical protein K426_26105 [Sphingobium sp. TKS]KKW90523.1 hypothetical protein YP76_18145 [Sphingobium chungbukense]